MEGSVHELELERPAFAVGLIVLRGEVAVGIDVLEDRDMCQMRRWSW